MAKPGKRRPSPKEKVISMLEELGYKVYEEDMTIVPGGSYKFYHEILECWNITGKAPDGREVLITSSNTLTSCARQGIIVERNPPHSTLYGQFLVHAKPEVSTADPDTNRTKQHVPFLQM